MLRAVLWTYLLSLPFLSSRESLYREVIDFTLNTTHLVFGERTKWSKTESDASLKIDAKSLRLS